jgi:transposase
MRGDIVVLDDLQAHEVAGLQEAIESEGATPRYLSKYSPDFNPIELPYRKLKTWPRKVAARPSQLSSEASARSCRRSALNMRQLFSTCRLCVHMSGICVTCDDIDFSGCATVVPT